MATTEYRITHPSTESTMTITAFDNADSGIVEKVADALWAAGFHVEFRQEAEWQTWR